MKMCGITEIMEIRKATERDIDEIVEVFNDAKKSMKKAGINQWDDSYDGYPSAEEAQIDIPMCYVMQNMSLGILQLCLRMM